MFVSASDLAVHDDNAFLKNRHMLKCNEEEIFKMLKQRFDALYA